MKTLKDLLRKKVAPVPGEETTIHIEGVRIPPVRAASIPPLIDLARSIEKDGLRHPVAVWPDGTLISGARRLRAHFFLAGEQTNLLTDDYRKIRAVFVDTVEDAAKRLLNDNADNGDAVPMKPSEMCRLWDVLAKLDEPAAKIRLNEARRQGVKHRKQTQSGQRRPGRTRSQGNGAEYLMSVLGEPFGMKEATASRLFTVYKLATNMTIDPERRAAAVEQLSLLDDGKASIWGAYNGLVSKRVAPSVPRIVAPVAPAPAARQRASWERALPQLEGLAAGLIELGNPNTDLTWEQVGPVHARLMKVRRDLEKIINGMKEISKS